MVEVKNWYVSYGVNGQPIEWLPNSPEEGPGYPSYERANTVATQLRWEVKHGTRRIDRGPSIISLRRTV